MLYARCACARTQKILFNHGESGKDCFNIGVFLVGRQSGGPTASAQIEKDKGDLLEEVRNVYVKVDVYGGMHRGRLRTSKRSQGDLRCLSTCLSQISRTRSKQRQLGIMDVER